jgi:lauroyl/myristoyl acyltransferase
VTFRHFLSWKSLFYDTLVPGLQLLGPARSDRVVAALGHLQARAWPHRRRDLMAALGRAASALGTEWDVTETCRLLEVNVLRFLVRDYLLDETSDADFFGRFTIAGYEHLRYALDAGQGVILVGCHLGNHLSAMHWMYRQNVPLRLLIQRVTHCSRYLRARFDVATGPHPQAGFFLRRDLTPEVATQRIFRTRSALRDGMAVYLKGDVPWFGSNTRPGRFLGVERPFQSLWAEFAGLFRAPVIPVFCTHCPGGRFTLSFDPPWTVKRGDEAAAVAHYLARLEAEIAAHPADAVAHLLWNCYGPETDPEHALSKRRKPTRKRRRPLQSPPAPVSLPVPEPTPPQRASEGLWKGERVSS